MEICIFGFRLGVILALLGIVILNDYGGTRSAMNDWAWKAKAVEFLHVANFVAAEELFIEAALEHEPGPIGASAINSLAYNILIPCNRIQEARIWLQQAINLEVGYESWNARSNLGICEFACGNHEVAGRYFQQIVDADAGPVAEAKEYLEKISLDHSQSKRQDDNFDFSEEWRASDLTRPLAACLTPRELYLQLLKFLSESRHEVDIDLFGAVPGAFVTGFATSIAVEVGPKPWMPQNAAAKSFLDYVNYQLLGIAVGYDALSYGEKILEQAQDCEEGLRHLRLAAGQGSAQAMFRVGQILLEELFLEDEALPWLRLAKANGYKEAAEIIEGLEEDRWV